MAKTKKKSVLVCYLTLHDHMYNNPSPCGKANPEPTSGAVDKVTCSKCLEVLRDRLKEDAAKIGALVEKVEQRLVVMAKRNTDGSRR